MQRTTKTLHPTMLDFLDHLYVGKGAAENTVSAYASDLGQFYLYADQAAPADVTAETITGFLQALADDGKSQSTIARRYAALRTYFHWLHMRKVITENPMGEHERPKTPPRRPATLTAAEVERLLMIELAPRDRAVLELLYRAGLRVSELIRLNVSDVDVNDGCLRIAGKNDRERVIPLSEKASAAVEFYLRQVRPHIKSRIQERALLLNYTGRRLSRQFAWKAVKDAAHAAGLKGVTPDMLRLSYGVHLLEQGVDPRSVQELLGHADASTTMTLVRCARCKREEAAA